MSYVLRNIHPSVIHIPDAGLRLDSGQTAVVESISPQMEELLVNRALEAISTDPDPPAATVPVDETPPVAPEVTEPATQVATVKKTRKSSAAAESEQPDDAQ